MGGKGEGRGRDGNGRKGRVEEGGKGEEKEWEERKEENGMGKVSGMGAWIENIKSDIFNYTYG